jgi:hypothetical protein
MFSDLFLNAGGLVGNVADRPCAGYGGAEQFLPFPGKSLYVKALFS